MKYSNIEKERIKLGLSVTELSKKVGVCSKTYYNWIKGDTPIPSDKLILLSKICNASIDYLLGIKKACIINTRQ